MANYVLLERIELNNTAASVTFDNIPQSGYTDLKVVVSARTSRSGNPEDEVFIRFNGSTTGYSSRSLFGTGAATSSNTGGTAQINRTWTTANGATSNTFGSMDIYIPNYRGSQNKSVSVDAVSENNATTAYAVLTAGLWSNSAAITSITLLPEVGPNFLAGSTFSLYGLAQVGTTPTIAPKADGGNVIGTDGTYWYHAFLSNGTFTPQVGLSCDYLVVAGGGGGGGSFGGGGGAGGLRSTVTATGGGGSLESAISVASATPYAITVGGGGTAGVYSGVFTRGGVGSNSTFSTITSTGGGGGGTRDGSQTNGATGGSGGGGAGGTGNTGASGTTNQGFAGGNGGGAFNSAGGGGGASALGTSGVSSTGGAGGNGVATSITGSSVTYGGGGGGGADYSGAVPGNGGTGGGGNGGSTAGSPVRTATAGTANTGGGGGGGGGGLNGTAGGSGIVIIRYLVA
jgi:hypothetical protein